MRTAQTSINANYNANMKGPLLCEILVYLDTCIGFSSSSTRIVRPPLIPSLQARRHQDAGEERCDVADVPDGDAVPLRVLHVQTTPQYIRPGVW